MVRPNKIAFLITDCDFGGAEQMLFELCRGLSGQFSMQVLSLKRKGHFGKLIEGLGIPVKSYGLAEVPGPGYPSDFLRALFKVRSELREFRPDLVQGVLFQGNLMARLAGRAAGVNNVLCSLHTFDRGRLKASAEKYTQGLAKKYIVVSDALAEFCAENYSIPRDKIAVIKNGIVMNPAAALDPGLAEKLGLQPGKRVVGTIGRLHREKGTDVLIQSFSRLAGEMKDLRLVIIGDGPERENLMRLAKGLGLGDRVLFAGFLPEPEKYLPLFDLFALPSRIEAMPVSLMFAMAAGRAVVATAVGAVPELIEDNHSGLLVPAEDELQLARAMSRLLADPELSKKLGANARAKAEKEFSIDRMIGSYLKLYSDALGGKS